MQASPVVQVDRSHVLGKAATRAAGMLGLTNKALGEVIGFSESTVSRVAAGLRGIDPESKEAELALLLIRVLRSLDALVGADPANRRTWMTSHNAALRAIPAERIRTAEGLVHTLAYLDGMRAPI